MRLRQLDKEYEQCQQYEKKQKEQHLPQRGKYIMPAIAILFVCLLELMMQKLKEISERDLQQAQERSTISKEGPSEDAQADKDDYLLQQYDQKHAQQQDEPDDGFQEFQDAESDEDDGQEEADQFGSNCGYAQIGDGDGDSSEDEDAIQDQAQKPQPQS